MSQPLWTPSAERVRSANLTRFTAALEARLGRRFGDYAELWRWSIEDRAGFWRAIWEMAEVRASHGWDEVLTDGERMPGARWFTGAKLNFAENLLRRADPHPALVARSEDGRRRVVSYRELGHAVARFAAYLRGQGVVAGDRVAGLVPNVPEAVIAMLATTSIGALWSSCSPDFGARAVLDRFGQIAPKVLVTCDGYPYAGKVHDCLEKGRELVRELPSVRRVAVIPYASPDPGLTAFSGAADLFPDAVASGAGHELVFEQLPFEHPIYVLYSSGTTGAPKCIVHGAGGTLLQHVKEQWLHTDLRPEDRFFYFTTCGWMMWNWLLSGLARGATLLLWDGSPFHPDPGVLWRIAAEEGITHFGTSAKYLAAAEKEGVRPSAIADLGEMRALLSTGSPLLHESFEYVYREVKRDLHLASISGGTDLLSCFALGNPCLPVVAPEIQCRGLGMAVDSFDDAGRPVAGAPGELVCTKPFPSMPVGFWNDPDQARYRATYFERFPGVWHHGDLVEITERGGVIVYGRSDATLNPGGVRIGTAEVYRPVESLAEIADSLVIGQEWQGDVRVVLFVKTRPGVVLDRELENKLRKTIRESASPRHVPARIVAVDDIPYTRSGKKVELAVRNVIHGRPVENRDALVNPDALDLYRDLESLRS